MKCKKEGGWGFGPATPIKVTQGGKYEKLGKRVGVIVDQKQKAYGDSSGSTARFLHLLYPDGIPPTAYDSIHLLIRIFDKLKRIASEPDAFGEDPFLDVAGYGLLGFEQACRKETKRERDEEIEEIRS